MIVEDVAIMSIFEDNMKDTSIRHMRQRWPPDLSKKEDKIKEAIISRACKQSVVSFFPLCRDSRVIKARKPFQIRRNPPVLSQDQILASTTLWLISETIREDITPERKTLQPRRERCGSSRRYRRRKTARPPNLRSALGGLRECHHPPYPTRKGERSQPHELIL